MYLMTWHNAKVTVIVIEERLDLLTYFVAGAVHPVAANSTYTHSAPSLCLGTQFLFPPDLLATLRIFHSSDVFPLFFVRRGGGWQLMFAFAAEFLLAESGVRFWTKVQLIRLLKGRTRDDFDFDILDATQVWPEELVPVQPIGE